MTKFLPLFSFLVASVSGQDCGNSPPSSVGLVSDVRIGEASGLGASRIHEDVLYTHNDSGDSPRIFALALDGEVVAEIEMEDAEAVDFEDMAVGPGPEPDVSYVYVADMGNNFGERMSLQVYRFPEPHWDDEE